MRKIYVVLATIIFVFANKQNILIANELQSYNENLLFINFCENTELNKLNSSIDKHSIRIKIKPDVKLLFTKAQSENNSGTETAKISQNETTSIINTEETFIQEQHQDNSDTNNLIQDELKTEKQPNTEQISDTENEQEITANVEFSLPEKRQISIEIPENNALVQKFLNQYTTDYAKKWLSAVMKNGAPYRGYIRAKIAEMELPECLEFLPVIESNFKIDAVSKSGAMGMWQFMKNSISPFGIRINEWMDERCDPWLATDAALKKLKENYEILGDWNLALAAYNSGLGAVSRACKKNPESDYWALCAKKQLKNESINYVPKFLAIAEILTNSEYYGIETTEFDETAHLNYELIDIKRNVDITLLAEQTSMDSKTIKFLNPALFYGVTPPNTVYKLRVPSEYKDAVTELINNKDKLLIKYHLYKIRSGDTVYALSRHYGVSEDMIKQANPGLKPSQLKIGNTICIPAFKDIAPYAGKSVNKNVSYTGSYIVQQGDSLWSISLKYNVQVESLAEANNMQVDSILRIGSTLKVPIIE